MSNEDGDKRKPRKSASSDDGREENSLGVALEEALQAGLQSLSDGLRTVAQGDTSGTVPSRRPPHPRPSAGRKQSKQNQQTGTVKRKRKKQTCAAESDECLIDTRFTDNEFIVIADMFGASIDNISAGVSPKTNELIISQTDTVVGRVDLPYASPKLKKAWFKNGILEIYLESSDSESVTDSPS